MRGHVRRRGKGWVFVVDNGRDPETNRRLQKWSRQFPTRKEAELELRRSLGRVDRGDDPIPERCTVAQLADRWFDHMESMERPRYATRAGYRTAVEKYVLPFLAGVEVAKVRPGDVQRVLDVHATTHAPGTTVRLKAVMSKMFATALAWSLCQVNPVSPTSTRTAPKKHLIVPEPDQVAAINGATSAPYNIPILLASYTGARRSEVLALTWRDVNLEQGTVRIERTLQRVERELVFSDVTKSTSGRRTVPLPAFVVAALRQYRADQGRRRLAAGSEWGDLDLVVDRGDGRPVSPDLLTEAFKRAAKAAGVEGVRLHDLRHSYLTRLARSGLHPVETSAIAGHSSPSFTAERYQHVDEAALERTRSAVEEVFGQ